MGSKIIAAGKYLPEQRLTNDDLSAYFETSHEWIVKRTGICQRHVSVSENTSDLAYQAAKNALAQAGVSAESIDFIIVATMSPDYGSPSTACLVQDKLGAHRAFAFDVNAACSGFVYALHTAVQLMENPSYQYGLVIGAETMTKLLDWSDRSTAILFGDGAGCVLLAQSADSCMKASILGSDGKQATALTSQPSVVINPLAKNSQPERSALAMNGRDIFNFAVKKVPSLIQETLQQAQQTDVDYYVCHQANARMIDIFAKTLAQPLAKFPMTIAQTGNTSAASIPIILATLVEDGRLTLQQQQHVVLVGFGGGLTWGSVLIHI